MAKNKSSLWIYLGVGVLAIVLIGVFLVLFTNQNVTKINTNIDSNELTNEEVISPLKLSKNCVEDGCPNFYECKLVSDKNECVKLKLENTTEYKNYKDAFSKEQNEYNKDIKTIDYNYISLKIQDMNYNINKLVNDYNVDIYINFVDMRQLNYNVNTAIINLEQKYKGADFEKDSFAKENFKQDVQNLIVITNNLKQNMNSFSIDEIYFLKNDLGYDLNDKKYYIDQYTTEFTILLENIDLGYKFNIDVTDYNPKCYSYDDSCFIDYVKLNIENVGGFDLIDPRFDIFIKKGDRTICREVDYVNYDMSDPFIIGLEEIIKLDWLCYDFIDDLTPGNYTLEINLKQGISNNYLASISKSINLE